MTIPVIICDDSSFARKQLTRALPKGWNVAITYARNGAEAVEALALGKGDILLLDLTMPVMDGFQVLEHIRQRDLQTMPIVISGDIQTESYQRVMSLGAVAFIKKPVDAEELSQVLDNFGVLDLLTESAPQPSSEAPGRIPYTEWCQEIANVAMGRAADLLVKMIEGKIDLSIPHVRLMDYSELEMTLNATMENSDFSCITQGFIGGGISGENLLLFQDAEIAQISRHWQIRGERTEEDEKVEFYMDIANILVGAFMKGLAEQLDVHFSQGHPRIIAQKSGNQQVMTQAERAMGKILTIEIEYKIGDRQMRCNQLILFTPKSIKSLSLRADDEVIWP